MKGEHIPVPVDNNALRRVAVGISQRHGAPRQDAADPAKSAKAKRNPSVENSTMEGDLRIDKFATEVKTGERMSEPTAGKKIG